MFILAFVGVKMILANHYEFPTYASLSIIIGVLVAGVVVSMVANRASVNISDPLKQEAAVPQPKAITNPAKEEQMEEVV